MAQHHHHQQMGGAAAAAERHFNVGDEVEVCFETNDVWFPATVVNYLSQNMYLVKHWFRKDNGEALLQNSNVPLHRIRPTPPLRNTKRGFVLLDKVDAFHDFAWNSGLIIDQFGNKQFMVSSKGKNNEMVFSEHKLRHHMEWIDGKWVDDFQPKGAHNDASQSRPSKNSEIEDAAEIANAATGCETDTTETKTPSKQNSSLKTPTSTMCQTNATTSKRRRNVPSLKTESPSMDDKIPKGAHNDASQSRPSKNSEIEDAAEVANAATGCETDTTETKTPSKQNSSQKTPTSTMCQTNAATSKRRRNVSSLKTESPSMDDKVAKVAKNGASHSSPSKKSKTETAAVIPTSTGCKTDATKKKLSGRQNSSQDPKTPTSTVCQTETASKRHSNVSSLKPEICSPDDKPESKKVSGLDSKTILSFKRKGRQPRTPQSSTKGAITTDGTNDTERKSERVETESSQYNIRRQSHTRGSQTSMSDHTDQGKNPAELIIQSEVSEYGASRSRPSKKSKIENAVPITTSIACKTDATKAKLEQISSQEPKTPTSTMCQTGATALERPSSISSLKTDSCSSDDKVTKGRKVDLLKSCTTESMKRMGKPPKMPQSATGGKESNKCGKNAEGTNVKECESENVLPLAHNGTKIPQDNIRRQSHMEGSETSISDRKGQGHNPAGLVTKGRPKNGEREQTERSLELSGPRSRKEIPTKSSENAKRAVPSDQQEKSSPKKRGKTSVDPSTEPHHSAVVGREKSSSDKDGKTSVDSSAKSHQSAVVGREKSSSEKDGKTSVDLSAKSHQSAVVGREKSSTEKDGKTSVDSSAKSHQSAGASRKETEVNGVAVDSSPCIDVAVNQNLPFEKTVPLWDCIESMEVFQSIPQNPHFRSLESCDEDCREGLAIAHMVTFLKITKKIPELRPDMPRSSMKSSLENLVVLEDNGFDVNSVRGRLNDLLVKKDKHDLLQNNFKEYESQISESKNRKAKIDEVLDEIDKKLNELREKRESVVSEKELKDALIAVSQSSVDDTTNQINIIKSDFEALASASLQVPMLM